VTSIVVVDDDAELRGAIERELGAQGFDVRGASSVAEAIALIETSAPEVLLTDLRMSEQDGIDLIRQARAIAPTTRTILMSAYATARDHQTATADGAVRVLCKPFTPGELTEAIRQAVESGTGFRGSVHGLSLVDLLQMFHYGRRSVRIDIGAPRRGEIHVQDGEVTHAKLGESEGAEALRALLASGVGALSTSPLMEAQERTIEVPFSALLLDLLRQVDESENREEPAGGSGEAEADPFALAWDDEPEPGSDPFDRRTDLVVSLDSRLAQVATGLDVSLVDLEVRRARLLQGKELEAELVEAIPNLVDHVGRISSDWRHFEMTSPGVAIALLKTGVDHHVVVASEALIGRYAQLKFRSKVVRIANII
jgi:CheY-like chemotaxis protein